MVAISKASDLFWAKAGGEFFLEYVINYSVIDYIFQNFLITSPALAQKGSDAFRMMTIGQSSKELFS